MLTGLTGNASWKHRLMTESKSAVEVIAEVLMKHGRTPESHTIAGHAPLYRCGCDPLGQPPRWPGAEHARHVAAEVDKALGGLTRDHDYNVLVDGAGRAVRLDNVARWIGGWTPEEAS